MPVQFLLQGHLEMLDISMIHSICVKCLDYLDMKGLFPKLGMDEFYDHKIKKKMATLLFSFPNLKK